MLYNKLGQTKILTKYFNVNYDETSEINTNKTPGRGHIYIYYVCTVTQVFIVLNPPLLK